MNFATGLVLIAITVAMIAAARPADGELAPFLKVWFVGQAYALTAMVSAVVGVAIAIINWPL